MRTAIIATVKIEARNLPAFLESLLTQTRKPDVVVITDGGSTDGTQDILAAFAARSPFEFRWSSESVNVPRGRNIAIEMARADVIAVTDMGVLDRTWFERIIAPLERGDADVVGGWFELLVGNSRERAVGLMTQYSLDQVRPETFLPSSRSVAFTFEAWRRVGGYPEDLNATEDTMFDLRLRQAGCRFRFEPSAIVHWRPATSAKRAFRMYRRFADWDARARVFAWSYSRYGFLFLAYLGGLALVVLGFFFPVVWLIFLISLTAYLTFRMRKVLRARLWSQVPYAVLVAFALDAGILSGYLRGRIGRAPPIPLTSRARVVP